jgi:hypothetical protein
MEPNKIQDFLIQLMQDMSYIKAKLEAIDEQKLNSRMDALEATCKEHDRVIKSLENRNNTMEQFVRNNITDSKKQQTGVFISMGLAVFSAIVSVIINFIF